MSDSSHKSRKSLLAVGASGSSPAERGGLYVFLAVAALVFLLPFIWLVSSSFKTQDRIFSLPPQVIPQIITMDFNGEQVEASVGDEYTETVRWVFLEEDNKVEVLEPGSPLWAQAQIAEASEANPFAVVTPIERDERNVIKKIGPPQLMPMSELSSRVSLNFKNFQTVLGQAGLIRAFFNTTLIAVLHVALTLFLCSLAGTAFAKYKRAPGHGWLFSFVLGTMMIPGAVTMIPIFVILAKVEMLNTYWAMIIPGAANAFGIFWMRQYITSNVPDDLYDAARIDGCTEFSVYWRIVVPIIQPAMGALGVLVMISIWNNLMWAFIVLRTENMQTMPLLVYLLQGEYQTPYGLIMAAGLITVLPLIIAFLLFQRAFISGITAGAVKS